jgi:hypothetical protein
MTTVGEAGGGAGSGPVVRGGFVGGREAERDGEGVADRDADGVGTAGRSRVFDGSGVGDGAAA